LFYLDTNLPSHKIGIRDICPKRHTCDRYLFIKSFAVGTHISLIFNQSIRN